ncbi:MAG: HDOD domain-containing protein [Clostridiaceae bacterium]|nr:HDOD domain-containing protein [Clostridiaceae bacterium]
MSLLFARQPIFDNMGRRHGYELLYREPGENAYGQHDGDMATSSVMAASFLSMGVSELSSQSKAYINFTSNMLLRGVATLFPKDTIVVEILETIEPTYEIIEACHDLRKKGYTIALDDFVLRDDYKPLIDLAHIVKIDFMHLKSEAERKSILQLNRHKNVKYLAEKVETREDYEMAVRLGYSLFQGYFFSKPVIINTNNIPPSKINQVRLMQLLENNDPDIGDIADVIEKDVAFTYEILKLTTTVRYYRGNKITSIRQAAMLMGLTELKKWAYITIIRKISDHDQEENISISVQRARALEQLAELTGNRDKKMSFFTLGLLSMIDVLTGCEMSLIVSELPVSSEMQDILLGNNPDTIMHTCFQLTTAYEKAQWILAEILGEKLGITMEQMASFYLDAVVWSNQATS